MMGSVLRFSGPALGLATLLVASHARADVSSWVFTGFGPSTIAQPGRSTDVFGSLQIDAGLGSSPAASFAMGGIVRMQVHFGSSTDFGAFWRTASGGYVRGNWGAALDLGGYLRAGTNAEGSPGAAATISLGAPLGITLNLDAARGKDEVTTLAAVVGIDFARFTIYRSTGLDWFPNVFASPSRER
jgi:hypothetical protein